MSAVDQAQMLMLGTLAISLGGRKIELAWASSTPRIERISGWTMLIAGLGFMISGALGTVF